MLKRKTRPVDRLRRKLQHVEKVDEFAFGETLPEQTRFLKRVFGPVMRRLQQVAATALPGGAAEDLRRRLRMAGNPGNMTPAMFMAFRFLAGILGGAIGLLLAFVLYAWDATTDLMGPLQWLLLVLLFAIGGYLFPNFYLLRRTRQRQRTIWKTLPDVLDMLTIAVEAGMGFDQAMERVGQRYRGILGEELLRTVRDVNMGRSRSEAMRDLGARAGVDELTGVAVAITQADRLGVSIGSVLTEQAQQLREQRAQRSREQAQKAPTKMMLPLVGCIFPAMFIVLMGPAAISTIREWNKYQETMQGGPSPLP
jgi:tight adherence protein C